MSTSYTTNVGLGCPATDDSGWDAPIRATISLLDSLAPIGSGGVRTREIPSSSLYVTVAPAVVRSTTGQLASYAGATIALAASSTVYLWLTDAGVLATGSTWPGGPYVPLAIVATGTVTIAGVTDARVVLESVGVSGRTSATTQAATYSILPSNGLVELNATSGAFTATLPSAVTNPGMLCRVIKIDSSSNAVTIATTSGQTINGASTIGLSSQWAGKTLVSDGSNWMAF